MTGEVSAGELSVDEDGTTEELSSLGLSFRLEKRFNRVQNERFLQRQETRQEDRRARRKQRRGDIAKVSSTEFDGGELRKNPKPYLQRAQSSGVTTFFATAVDLQYLSNGPREC